MNEAARILVVDDTPLNVKLLFDLLSAQGYRVQTASSGAEALRRIAEQMPDLVLLDVVMPEMTGYEVCKQVRDNPKTAALPIVLVTSLDPREEKIRGLEVGADDFLTKPINQPELLARVRTLLRVKSLYDTVQEQAAQLSQWNKELEQRVAQQVSQLERLSGLKRFFPPQLVELIVAGDVEDPLKTHRREVTVVFLDLRGFTAFTDSSEPEEIMSFLRDYHREMGRLIHSHGGTLEQFAGDSLMVIFNDPVVVDDPAERAVRMAVEIRERFVQMMLPWKKRGHDIGLGLGIAHGYATIGTIGFEDRIGYGVIGRVTNMAARLCSEAKAGQILISQPVFAQVEELVEVEDVGELSLKGFHRPVPACNVVKLK
jgi:class 3 adenylate cyclase/CheY-like chemotaxis protein